MSRDSSDDLKAEETTILKWILNTVVGFGQNSCHTGQESVVASCKDSDMCKGDWID
jgi:hypothetical protein